MTSSTLDDDRTLIRSVPWTMYLDGILIGVVFVPVVGSVFMFAVFEEALFLDLPAFLPFFLACLIFGGGLLKLAN